MRIRYISGTLAICAAWPLCSQTTDTASMYVPLDEVTVTESYHRMQQRKSALAVEVLRKDFFDRNFTGNTVQAMAQVPGVRSMDIGSGFSKPVIRGLGFNRIAVSENGIKQEGQQWGADHGLEIDAFGVEEVQIRKGPSSLLYGSDAMGGAIELLPPPPPPTDRLFGEATLLGKSGNGTLGYSLMAGVKRGPWLLRARFSQQHFGDYRVPIDTVVYLTRPMPVVGRRLKNTAGNERHTAIFGAYDRGRYRANLSLSHAHQRTGFFPGAHGVPDLLRLADDGNRRNIELPYSRVDHFKATTRQQYVSDALIATADIGYQLNRREEWSAFHTHYASQTPPNDRPDRELAFDLHTLSTALRLRWIPSTTWEHTAGLDVQGQSNRVGGYSFLLPEFQRLTAGLCWLTSWRPDSRLTVSGGVRYDVGIIDVDAYADPHLAIYLRNQGYDNDVVEAYRWRSAAVSRRFGDWSFSAGAVWAPSAGQLFKLNIGRSFRLPGAAELASNGVHHGAFRHELGDAALPSEQGWQLDASYSYTHSAFELSFTPFASYFEHYIHLRPSGQWSPLPHAGQIYRYTAAEALFAGGEMSVGIDLPASLRIDLHADAVYTHNIDEHTAVSFSPPASLRSVLTWRRGAFELYAEWQGVAAQHRIARNEDPTPGASLWHVGASWRVPVAGTVADVSLAARNLFDTPYFNHLSFYRKIGVAEPGRDLRLIIKVPIKHLLQ